MAEGDYSLAFNHFRQLFDQDGGGALHFHISYLGVADLALAAVLAEKSAEGRELIQHAHNQLDAGLSQRIQHSFNRAYAVLAASDAAEPFFVAALSADTARDCPFERAQLHLDYAKWLRRERRVSQSRLFLLSALETFQRLGSSPWVRRVEAELRTCGITQHIAPSFKAGLTSQEWKIVSLASSGLTNREIGEQVFLSARTVGSHLYRAYPKLGVSSRRQLRDVIATSDAGYVSTSVA